MHGYLHRMGPQTHVDAGEVTRGDDFAALRDLIADGLVGVGADEDGF